MRKNVVQLRDLLREKFPGLRLAAESPPEKSAAVWPSGLAQIDGLPQGGLPQGGITELVSPAPSSGGALALHTVTRRALEANQFVALVDAHDSFDPSPFANELLARLLWVRCRDAAQALKAADFVLRDGNLPLVALDLALSSPAELRKISSSAWHRFRRIVEHTSTTLLVVTPQNIVGSADARLVLHSRFTLESLERDSNELLAELKVELAHARSLKRIDQQIAEVS